MVASVATAPASAGKYLTFSLAGEHYGLEILRVQEIVGLLPITRVPRLPEFVAGVVNLRGRIIPVVDLRLAFGLEGSAMDERTCVIVVEVLRPGGNSTITGVLVDAVSDVVDFAEETVEATPEFSADVDTSFIKGVGRAEDRVVLLLDIDRALSNAQMEIVERAAVDGSSSGEPEEGVS